MHSVQGNCSDPWPAATLITTAPGLLPPPLPIKASQCVVIIGDSAMQFLGGTQWLDNIYFRLQRTAVDPAFVALEIAWPEPRTQELHASETPEVTLYMTNVSVQGQRRGSSHVLTAMRGSKVLAQGVALCSDMHVTVNGACLESAGRTTPPRLLTCCGLCHAKVTRCPG